MDDAEPSPHSFPRVTVRDIAKELGLHFTTVAEALRNSRRIRKETREKVQAAAKRMGYRPDPILSALLAYRTQKQRHEFQGLLAWVCNHPKRDFFQNASGFYQECWEGARERAQHYGFELEAFWLGERGMSVQRAAQILRARSIFGLLVAPQPLGTKHLNLPWERFCAVRIGYSLRDLPLPVVAPDQFYNTVLLYQKLAEKGFRRIGLACPRAVDERVDHGFSGGYLSAREAHGRTAKKLPLYLDADPDGDPAAFIHWFERHRPDVIMLVPGPAYYRALLNAGYRIPNDVSVASLDGFRFVPGSRQPLGTDDPGLDPTGINQAGVWVGEAAVDILVSMINRNAVGIPPYFRKTLVGGRFVDGSTCHREATSR